MPAAVRSRSRAAFPVTAALVLIGCAVAAPGAENDEWIGQSMQDDLDASAPDVGLVDPEPVEPIDPGIIVPPFGSVAGTSGGAAGGTTGGATPPPRDASTSAPRDASTSAPRDAGTTPPPTTTPRDAGRPPSGSAGGSTGSAGGRCNALTCTNTCSLAGPIPCCTLLDTCGCTWAPGAYCL